MEVTQLQRYPVETLFPMEMVDDPNNHMAPSSSRVFTNSTSLEVVEGTTRSPTMVYHCEITISEKIRQTLAFRNRNIFSANSQTRGSGNGNKIQVEKTSKY